MFGSHRSHQPPQAFLLFDKSSVRMPHSDPPKAILYWSVRSPFATELNREEMNSMESVSLSLLPSCSPPDLFFVDFGLSLRNPTSVWSTVPKLALYELDCSPNEIVLKTVDLGELSFCFPLLSSSFEASTHIHLLSFRSAKGDNFSPSYLRINCYGSSRELSRRGGRKERVGIDIEFIFPLFR